MAAMQLIDKRLIRMEGVPRVIALCALLEVFKAFCVVGQAMMLASCIVGAWSGEPLNEQLIPLLFFAVFFLARKGLWCVLDAMSEELGASVASRLLHRYMATLLELGPLASEKKNSAKIVTNAIEGTGNIAHYVRLIIPKSVGLIILPCVIALAVLMLDPLSGIIVLICYPFIVIFMRLIGHTASDESAKRLAGFQHMAQHFMDSVRGLPTLKAFDRDVGHSSKVFAASEKYRKRVMSTLRIGMLSSAVLDIFATCGLAAVAIMLGFRLVEGGIAFYPALAVLMLVPEYFLPIKSYAADYHASLDGRTALQEVQDLIDEGKQERAWTLEDSTIDNTAALDAALAQETMPTLAFDRLRFSYPDHMDALHNISFSVSGPATVVIVGASGSGKSTLLDVIGGFLEPDCGQIEVDGHLMASLRVHAWRSRIAYIPQSPHLFQGTLADNIRFYAPYVGDEEVKRVVEIVGLSDLVDTLPEGILTVIGTGGRQVSGGQAHRIALARALIDPRRDIWLLDEPTSHLDSQTELELKEHALPLMENKLVFLATHRLHWLDSADVVIEMDKGRAKVRVL